MDLYLCISGLETENSLKLQKKKQKKNHAVGCIAESVLWRYLWACKTIQKVQGGSNRLSVNYQNDVAMLNPKNYL